jgi:lipid-A-disaccharide synthase
MIIAGEASGDMHGANLARALSGMAPGLRCCGVGGAAMQGAGVDILVPSAELSVVGITEVATKIPALIRGRRRVLDALDERRPVLLILIDFPDFNLHVAKHAKRLGIPVLYYISPQIWAWREGRVNTIGNRVDHVAVILPFEAEFYRRHGVPVTYVGHPLLDRPPLDDIPPASALTDDGPVIGLLPGSRDREVGRLLPVMLEAAARIHEQIPDARFLVSRAPTVASEEMDALLKSAAGHLDIAVSTDDVRRVFAASTFVIAASGTVTLEAALSQTPMVIVYRVSPGSYWLGRLLIRVPFIGLANLIANEAVVPELIQNDASAHNIAGVVCGFLVDGEALAGMREKLGAIREQLGPPGASDRVARIALDLVEAGREATP